MKNVDRFVAAIMEQLADGVDAYGHAGTLTPQGVIGIIDAMHTNIMGEDEDDITEKRKGLLRTLEEFMDKLTKKYDVRP